MEGAQGLVMAWIESHQDLAHHPKVVRLARALDISVPTAIGHLHCFWWWCLSYAEDGDVTSYQAPELARGAQWDGDPDLFIGALEDGWLDSGRVHDWWDYAGKLVERRQEDAARKRNMRGFYSTGTAEEVKARDGDQCRYCGKDVNWSDRRSADGATYDHIYPGDGEEADNIVVACRGCNSRKGKRTPNQAGMTLRPVPDRAPNAIQDGFSTQPNPTQPTNRTAADLEFDVFHRERALEEVRRRRSRGIHIRSEGGLAKTIAEDPTFIADSKRMFEHRGCKRCRGKGSIDLHAPGGDATINCPGEEQ